MSLLSELVKYRNHFIDDKVIIETIVNYMDNRSKYVSDECLFIHLGVLPISVGNCTIMKQTSGYITNHEFIIGYNIFSYGVDTILNHTIVICPYDKKLIDHLGSLSDKIFADTVFDVIEAYESGNNIMLDKNITLGSLLPLMVKSAR